MNLWIGLAILALSGVLNASFPLPLKYARSWKWENSWLVFTTLALLVIPVALAAALVPDLAGVYSAVAFTDFLPALVFGFLWGTAQVTFGLSIALVGMAMAFAIVVGMSGFFGSLIAMAVLHPNDLFGPRGFALMASAVILTVGLVLYGRAGREREAQSGAPAAASAARFRNGLLVCLYTGAMGGMLNLGFAFSGRIVEQAASRGASQQNANLAVWAVVLAAGYVPNLLYTAHLLYHQRTFRCFALAPGRESLLSLAAAVLWLGGTLGYGSGATVMGPYGTSIGYGIYVTILMLWSSTLGVLTGEWRQAKPATVNRMRAGVAIIIVALLVLVSAG